MFLRETTSSVVGMVERKKEEKKKNGVAFQMNCLLCLVF